MSKNQNPRILRSIYVQFLTHALPSVSILSHRKLSFQLEIVLSVTLFLSCFFLCTDFITSVNILSIKGRTIFSGVTTDDVDLNRPFFTGSPLVFVLYK
jgi:Na+-translocating ferredoxin:NAD+ oxidoreductase RnfD subunit